MKELLIYIFILVCSDCMAQTTREQVVAFENDVKAYSTAVDKIVKQNDLDDGIAELTSLINRCEKEIDYSRMMLSSFYKGRGHGYFRKKEYSLSVSDYKKAISLLQKVGEEGRSEFSNTWYQLSLAYYYWGKPLETMNAADKCVESAESYYGSYHSNTLDAYSLRSNYEGFYNKGQEAMQDRKKCFEIIRSNVERNFTYLTASERAAYWEKYLPETTAMFAFAQKLNEQQSEFTDALFNQQLLAKGLLLTAESALQRAIDSDPNLYSAYQRIRSLRTKASDSKTTSKEAEVSILEADRIERELGTEANSLRQFMNFLSINVDDVRNKLNSEDIAVEFVDYKVGKDSTMYAALVISPKWEHVRFIPLIEEKEVKAHRDNLADYIWQPILSALKKAPKNIYFAPSGLLYLIPIESQFLQDGRLMCESFNLFRLSSTRWLADIEKKNERNKKIAIYGGLLYDMSLSDMEVDTRNYGIKNSFFDREIVNHRGGVASLKYLPGTLVEVEDIYRNIVTRGNANYSSVNLYTGKNGTESSFKSLSGRNFGIIHIATHGFYSSKAKDSLTGAGLYFSGANNLFKKTTIPPETDDGLLTALEISELDFKGLDLVVLSACQTGLGQISTDGVQGLQRGFKKSGCKSLVMSLWNVDDIATKFLMNEFYNDLLRGYSKQKAFEMAKKKLRNNPKYREMKYWSAFIILDSID